MLILPIVVTIVACTPIKNTNGWNSGGNGTNCIGASGLPGGIHITDGFFADAGNFDPRAQLGGSIKQQLDVLLKKRCSNWT